MSLNTYRKNCHFPLSSLPSVVICHIAQYLRPRDLGNLSEVNHHFHQLFNSPQFWKGIKISWDRNSKIQIDPQVLKTIKSRGITELDIQTNHHTVESNIDLILQCLSHLEGLSFCSTTLRIRKSLQKFGLSGHLDKLKKLSCGYVFKSCWGKSHTEHFFTTLFKHLPSLEKVSFGSDDLFTHANELQLGSDLQRALCQSGKLTSISLLNLTIMTSCLNAIMRANPHLQNLSLGNISSIKQVGDDLVDPTVCSRLSSLELFYTYTCHSYNASPYCVLKWAFSGMEPNTSVTSLNLSRCPSFKEVQLLQVFSQLPALRKLNLTRFNFPNMFSFKTFCSLPNLEWLDVNGCNRICGPDLSVLSSSVGKTLRYLGLADLLLCLLVEDIYLMDLPSMFPVLRTLDLSGCLNITDALLVEWYVRNDESSWPKLRKLVLKNCGVSQGVVNSVRLKTRNQLLVEL